MVSRLVNHAMFFMARYLTPSSTLIFDLSVVWSYASGTRNHFSPPLS